MTADCGQQNKSVQTPHTTGIQTNGQPSFVTTDILSIWACISLSIYLFCSVANLDMILSVLVPHNVFYKMFLHKSLDRNTIHLCQSKWHLKGKNPPNDWVLGSFVQGRRNLDYFINTVFVQS